MPITKKDRIKKDHKKAEEAGTRIAVHKNGTPVKAAKEKSICQFCRKELPRDNRKQLEDHAGTHNDSWPKEKCWPNDFS